MNADKVVELTRAASEAVAIGDWQKAEALWQQVRRLDPAHVQALYSLGVHAYRRGEFDTALTMLRSAQAVAGKDPMIPLTISVIHRDLNDADSEWAAIMAALTIDAYFLPALLSKGEFLARTGRSRAAAAVFRDVLKVAPPEPSWPAALRRRLEQARAAVNRDTEDMFAFLNHQVAAQRTAVGAALADRWDEAASIMAGRSKPYASTCNQLHVPRLPAETFYAGERFAWIDAVQAMTASVTDELRALLSEHDEDFTPYIAYRPGDPVNQWQALNHSRNWRSLHLWAHGRPVDAHLARCPATAELLSLVDVVRIPGLCPNAMFSVLAPHTRIPPHHGETNARLVAHLPLVVPPDCSLRVGYDWRSWEVGKVLVFDDTIEHEARNDSNETRVVLIFDVWNPALSMAERDIVSALASACSDYRAATDV